MNFQRSSLLTVLVSATTGISSSSNVFVSAFQPISSFRNSKLSISNPISGISSTSTNSGRTCKGQSICLPFSFSTPKSTIGSTSLDMKVTIDIDIDLPEFDLFNEGSPLLDSSAFSSLISSLTSVPIFGDGTGTPISNYNFLEAWTTASSNSIAEITTQGPLDIIDVIVHAAAVSSFALLATAGILFALSFPPEDFRENYEPYGRGEYDPQVAREYYSRRPLLVLRRFLQLLRISNKWIYHWLHDRFVAKNHKSKVNQQLRAEELLEIIQNVGPTAIKVGQALSVRPDLIPEVYTKTLSELQDNVPPFDSDEAQELLMSELGYEKFQLLKGGGGAGGIDLDRPVASASIGQVYRGKVIIDKDSGEEVEVAVKVQRPNVLSEIALDLFIAREIAPMYQKLTMSDTNLQSLADEWGRGFIAELTYEQEAKNTIRFNEEMKEKNMNAVCAPTVVEQFSTNRILTTEWVNGVRLDRSGEEDVARLCGIALNAYLVMLLETGTLHCDPHPGNLLRTEDGKLCILDFGMTLETPEDLQYSLLEFIAHLTSENYDAIPQDLVNLQFLKQDKLELFLQLGVLEPMFYFFKQAANGGGGAKVRDRIMEEYRQKYPGADDDELRECMRREIVENTEKLAEKASSITGITMKIEDLQRENSDAFVIPEWFLYTSRAFLTLEGISLQADPDFSIIKSCFPYIAKRLIGDDAPRSQAALKNMIYGEGEHINPEKITELAGGFTQYTTTTKIVSQGSNNIKNDTKSSEKKSPALSLDLTAEAALALAKDSADILLHPTGNLVQNLIVEESATVVHANVKDALREILIDQPERLRSTLPFGFLIPKFPGEQVALFLQKSQREEQVQTLMQKFPKLSPPSPEELGNVIRSIDTDEPLASLVDGMTAEEIAAIWKALRENAPVYAPRVAKLGGKFGKQLFEKVSEDIDSVISATEESSSFPDAFVRNSAKGISAVAKAAARASADSTKD